MRYLQLLLIVALLVGILPPSITNSQAEITIIVALLDDELLESWEELSLFTSDTYNINLEIRTWPDFPSLLSIIETGQGPHIAVLPPHLLYQLHTGDYLQPLRTEQLWTDLEFQPVQIDNTLYGLFIDTGATIVALNNPLDNDSNHNLNNIENIITLAGDYFNSNEFDYAPGEIIVHGHDDSGIEPLIANLEALGFYIEPFNIVADLNFVVVTVDPNQELEVLGTLFTQGISPYTELNCLRSLQEPPQPKDPLLKNQWYLRTINWLPVWQKVQDLFNKKPAPDRIIVAVIDTGVNIKHDELKNSIWANPTEQAGKENVDDDHNKLVDDTNGWDFRHNKPNPNDPDGHGTNVAGIIAAQANTNSITGIAPVTIMPLRVGDYNRHGKWKAKTSNTARAILYAVDNKAKIINISLGSYGTSQAEQKAIAKAESRGVLVVAAVGNYNPSATRQKPKNRLRCMQPASFSTVLAVGASNKQDRVSRRSNVNDCIDIIAPGESITTISRTGNKTTVTGTSFATPITSGGAALLWYLHPSWNLKQLRSAIANSGKAMEEYRWESKRFQFKRLDLQAANAYKP